MMRKVSRRGFLGGASGASVALVLIPQSLITKATHPHLLDPNCGDFGTGYGFQTQNCFVCRKPAGDGPWGRSGHFQLDTFSTNGDRIIRVLGGFHPQCHTPNYQEKSWYRGVRGCMGIWRPWMGLMLSGAVNERDI